jgi:putative transposase
MKKKTWKSTPNAVYEINYHFVWSTKYRKPILVPPVDVALKDLLTQTAA